MKKYIKLSASDRVMKGDEFPITKPQNKNVYDSEGNPIFKKSVVPRYRPFVEGDVIEEGDIFIGVSGSWVEIKDWYAGGLTNDMIGSAKYRKLIK